MAKDKVFEVLYKKEGLKRLDDRIKRRKEKRGEKIKNRSRFNTCRGCGEDPYCYCGDGTPYSY